MKNFLNFLHIQTGSLKNILLEIKGQHTTDTDKYKSVSVHKNNKK